MVELHISDNFAVCVCLVKQRGNDNCQPQGMSSDKHINTPTPVPESLPIVKPSLISRILSSGILFGRLTPWPYLPQDHWKVLLFNILAIVILFGAMIFFIVWDVTIGNAPKLTVLAKVPTEAEYNSDEAYDLECSYGIPMTLSELIGCEHLGTNVSLAILEAAAKNSSVNVTDAAFVLGRHAMTAMTRVACRTVYFNAFTLMKRHEYIRDLQRTFFGLYYAAGTGASIGMTWIISEGKLLSNESDKKMHSYINIFLPSMYLQVEQVVETAAIHSYNAYFHKFMPRRCQRYLREEAIKVVLYVVNSTLSVRTILFAVFAIILGAIAK